jgi:TolB-like protein
MIKKADAFCRDSYGGCGDPPYRTDLHGRSRASLVGPVTVPARKAGLEIEINKQERIAMMYHYTRTVWIILTSVIFAFCHVSPSLAKAPKRVAILPFTINAERDVSFLRDGIMDMLSSRLLTKGEMEVVEKQIVQKKLAQFTGPLNRERATLIGKALQADYVIFGSLTVIGENVSIDATVLDVAENEELVTASKQSKGMDEVIPTVNQFAQEINKKIMGKVVAGAPVSPQATEAPRRPGGLIDETESIKGKEAGYVQRFDVQIVGLDVGDVDGDGKNDLVFIDTNTVYIYKWVDKSFRKWRALKGRWSPYYAYVSVADLDRNGNAEIYVSNPDGVGISSLVLEWDGSSFKKISKGQPWFFRVTDIPGKGKTLIGQKREMGGGFLGDVQLLKREGNRFVSAWPVKLPRFGNVFNFAFMDLEGRGKTHTIMLDSSEYLRLYDPQGEKVWISEEKFGGTYTFMDTNEEERIYFPSPIYLTDADGDGEHEVMVCKNDSYISRLFSRLRSFSGGALHFMTWDQLGLSMRWKSRKQPGPIVGYRLVDVDNDGLPELVVASVTRQGATFRKPRSQVVVFDLR